MLLLLLLLLLVLLLVAAAAAAACCCCWWWLLLLLLLLLLCLLILAAGYWLLPGAAVLFPNALPLAQLGLADIFFCLLQLLFGGFKLGGCIPRTSEGLWLDSHFCSYC